MKHIFKILIFGLVALLFNACASKKMGEKPTADAIINKDILGIGLKPTPPADDMKGNPRLVSGFDLDDILEDLPNSIPQTPLNPPSGGFSDGAGGITPLGAIANSMLKNSNEKNNITLSSTPQNTNDEELKMVSIISYNGAVLLVWATKPGNWIWGYSALDSRGLKSARLWKIITNSDRTISIQNVLTKTCLSAYNNGTIHLPCNSNNNTQKWIVRHFNNQATQFKSVSNRTCLQTPIGRSTSYYKIFLVPCAERNNLDQQWHITAPLISTSPIFVLN